VEWRLLNKVLSVDAAKPAVVFETHPQGENWGKTLKRIGRFLTAGVSLVCVLDEKSGKVVIWDEDSPPRILPSFDALPLGGMCGAFSSNPPRKGCHAL
jgi:hypothetical protein